MKNKPLYHNGVEITDKRILNDIQQIKSALPKNTTNKNIIDNYFNKKYKVQVTTKRPVNNVLDNIKEAARRNDDFKVMVKQEGENDFKSMNINSAEILLNNIHSMYWRKAKELQDAAAKKRRKLGTLIPIITITQLLEASTREPLKISIDFTSIDFK